MLTRALLYRLPMPIWKWADESVVYPDSYPTEFGGRFNSGFLPFYRPILDWCQDPEVFQINILKCSQSMCTGTVAENFVRYAVARSPCDILYIGAQQEQTEKMFEARFKKGLQVCTEETAAAMSRARERGMDIFFERMIFSAVWSTSLQGVKSFSYRVVIGDEVSIFDDVGVVDKVRKRLETAAFAKLILMSSMDKKGNRSASDDPMLLEYKASDACEWMMEDPGAKGSRFRFEMGFRDREQNIESPYGLKWSKDAYRGTDGTWDLKRVMESAHYVTPSGAVLRNEDKDAVVNTGVWTPTNANGVPGSKGARVTRWMLPFVTFSKMAHKFHHALQLGKPALRVFVLEDLVEEFWDDRQQATEDDLAGRVATYPKGTRMTQADTMVPGVDPGKTFKEFYIGKTCEVLTAVDVQQDHFRMVSREWVKGGDSGLVWFGPVVEWPMLDQLANEHGASYIYIDNTYPARRHEVYENSWLYRGMVPCIFKDSRMLQDWTSGKVNPFEGTRRQDENHEIAIITFDADVFRSKVVDLIAGRPVAGTTCQRWFTYAGVEREYRREVTSMQKVDGQWVHKKGQSQDHYFACEVLQVLGATVRGLMSTSVEVEGRA